MAASLWQPGGNLVNSPENNTTEQSLVATAGQTVFTLTNFSYTPGAGAIIVYRNGQRLRSGVDFTETSATTFTLVGITVVAGEVITAVVSILSTYAADASASATAAAASATSASSSATAAAASATTASTAATTATNQATAASSSATAAATSETNAAASATTASGAATTATTQATAAAASATTASTAATNAAASAAAAASSETLALAASASAAASYDSFDDRYLGAKAADPTLDNDGNALLTGALYFNTTTNVMRVYSGAAWADVSSTGGGGATGGGTDAVFYENDQTVNTSYTITTNKNAISAGPITIAAGVTVTVPAGSVWHIA